MMDRALQRPHPPLWWACSRRETIQFAARKGIGALSFSFVEPEDAGRWVEDVARSSSSEECVPVGFDVDPNVAVRAADDDRRGRGRSSAASSTHFFGYSLAHYYGMGKRAGRTVIVPGRVPARTASAGCRAQPLAVGSLAARGYRDPGAGARPLPRRLAHQPGDLGLQAGPNRHEHICESLELFAKRCDPGFAEGRNERDSEKARRRLDGAVERASWRGARRSSRGPGGLRDRRSGGARACGP